MIIVNQDCFGQKTPRNDTFSSRNLDSPNKSGNDRILNMGIAIFLFIAGAIGLVVWGVVASKQETFARLPVGGAAARPREQKFDLGKIFPARVILEKLRMTVKIKNALDTAHLNITPEAFFNLKLLIIILIAVLAVGITRKIDPMILLFAFGFGYILPDFYLKRRIAQCKYLVARCLPETVDLLGLCIEAGLDFVSAVKWVIDKTPSTPMIEELNFVLEEIRWGKPRVQALKDMSRRLNIPEISSFVQTLIQAERMGTPVAEAFAILSEDARAQRFHRGERIALQAPIKILIPLIFFIMPVIGIVIGGPIMIQFMQGGLSGLK